MSKLTIVADENIPFAREAFAQFGDVRLAPGRELTRDDLLDVDALVVRSVTKVNAALIDDTPVRFVGTATIGRDHIDETYLADEGITFADAAGCNSRSVAEWVVCALLETAVARRTTLAGKTLGIVGHGNIGSIVAQLAPVLGMEVLINDPPLARAGVLQGTVPLEDLLRRSDFVTLHVPLSKEGADRTHHLIGERELALMRQGSVLLNAARGPVLDNLAARESARIGDVDFIIDVFENEPTPDRELADLAKIVTPHIAGYSFEGKVNGTRMMAEALARHLGAANSWQPNLAPPENREVRLWKELSHEEALLEAVRASYRIREDDERLRGGLLLPSENWGTHFDQLRRSYPVRREFANYVVRCDPSQEALNATLAGLGFSVETVS